MVTRSRNSDDRPNLQVPLRLSEVPQIGGATRRLAAIMSADIRDYSRLMGMDEEGTLARVKRVRREVIDPTISEHHGRLIKNTGDGVLAMFDSPVEAVRCAVVIQQSMVGRNALLPRSQWLEFRIGVNLGDVIVDPDDVYGDGVNIAARLQAMAQAGGVYISGGVYEQIKNKLVCGYQSLGDEKLKNITDPVRVYRVLPDPAAVERARRSTWPTAGIAVLFLLILGACGWLAWPSVRGFLLERPQQVAAPKPLPPVVKEPPAKAPPSPEATLPAPVPKAAPPPAPPPAKQEAAPAPQAAPPPVVPTAPPVVPTAPPVKPEAAPAQVPSAPPQDTTLSGAPQRPPMTAPYELLQDCSRCPELVKLPAGKFTMGSNDQPSERPTHTVSIAPFAIGRFAVTFGEWKQCVAAKACTYNATGDDDLPVHNLSWNDAQQYVTWLSKVTRADYRLPTEAEWEYAARGNTTTRFWWGNQYKPGMANCQGCGEPYDARAPLKVGSFPANPFGLHDMAGGVSQWVSDCWHRDYVGASRNGESRESPNCAERILRGGSWRNDSSYARPTNRDRYDPNVRYLTHGLRVARSL